MAAPLKLLPQLRFKAKLAAKFANLFVAKIKLYNGHMLRVQVHGANGLTGQQAVKFVWHAP